MTDTAVPGFKAERAVLPSSGEPIWVIYQSGHGLHPESTDWLRYLADVGHSPETIRNYALRVAWYLSWSSASGYSWREPNLTVLAEWKNTLLSTPYASGESTKLRKPKTVDAWMISVTEFYKWAGANGLVEKDRVDTFFDEKYLAPGVKGGETGRTVRVKARELTVPDAASSAGHPEWLESPEHRQALLDVELTSRDRFLVDLLYSTGVRGGEALSLFRENLHFLQDNSVLGCRIKGPHIHVKRNPTRNGARAKGSWTRGAVSRWVPVPADVVYSYEAYRFERAEVLGADENPHVFVNLYGGEIGAAWKPDSLADLFERLSQRLGFYVRPHMLRHTRATMWLRGIDCERLDQDTVQELLGHASSQSTAVYVHRVEADLRRAVSGVTLRAQPDKSADGRNG